jgi:chaperonin cofactor prefoldin
MEIQAMVITPIKTKIPIMIQNATNELYTTQSQIEITHLSLQVYEQNMRREEDAVRALESKVSDDESASMANDVFVSHRCRQFRA